MSQFAIALSLATEYHAGQKYGEKEYMYHLMGVMRMVRDAGGDEFHQTVAILHDILEDTSCTAHKMRVAGVGENIIETVQAITKSPNESNKQYLKRCWENKAARFVKYWDSMFNLTHSIREGNAKRIKKYTGNIAFLAEYKSAKEPK